MNNKLSKYSPIADLFSLRNNDYFDNLFNNIFRVNALAEDNGKDLVYRVDVPGFDEKDIKIEIKDEYLNVIGETKTGNQTRFVSKSVYLGDEVETDKIDAVLEKGVLTITLPKKEVIVEEPKTKIIAITTK